METQLPSIVDIPGLEEGWCREFALCGDPYMAYRKAYGCATASNRAVRLAVDPLLQRKDLQDRVAAILEDGKSLSGITIANVLKHWLTLATADVNEIVQHRRLCCRYCWGEGFGYQWTEAAYWKAVAEAIDALKPEPDKAGGFGFDQSRGPNPECPECSGEGISDVYVADTRYLSPSARLLYNGVKQTRYGLEVVTESRSDAWKDIARFLGMYIERVKVEDLTRPAAVEGQVELGSLSQEALVGMFRELADQNKQTRSKRNGHGASK